MKILKEKEDERKEDENIKIEDFKREKKWKGRSCE